MKSDCHNCYLTVRVNPPYGEIHRATHHLTSGAYVGYNLWAELKNKNKRLVSMQVIDRRVYVLFLFCTLSYNFGSIAICKLYHLEVPSYHIGVSWPF